MGYKCLNVCAGQRTTKLEAKFQLKCSTRRRICVSRATNSAALKSFDDETYAETVSRMDRRIASIAIPTLAALAAEPVATLVGATWVGRMGTMPLAACAAAVSIFSLATKLINLPLTAVTTSLVATASAHSALIQQSPGNPGSSSWRNGSPSKCTWHQNRLYDKCQNTPATQEQRAAISSALVLGIMIGILQGALLLVLGKQALQLWCTNSPTAAATVQTAHTYLTVRAIGAPLNSSLLVLQAACRGMGNAGLSLRAAVVANIANLALDPLLIFGLSFGVKGAALATVAGQAVALADLLLRLLNLRAVGGVHAGMLQQIRMLVPSTALLVLRSAAISGCFAFATATVTRIGTTEAAAHAICFQVWLASSLLVDSLAVAAQALIGQNATINPAQALVVAQRAITWALRLGCTLCMGLLVTRTYIPHLFSADAVMYGLAVQVLWWVALLQPINALAFVWDGILYGVNGFKYAAMMMPFNVAPAIFCMTVAAKQKTSLLALGWVWTGLALVMALRALTIWIPFRQRANVFSILPPRRSLASQQPLVQYRSEAVSK